MDIPCRVSDDLRAFQTAQNNAPHDERDYVFEANENIEDPLKLEWHVEYADIARPLSECFNSLAGAGAEIKDVDLPHLKHILRQIAQMQRYCFTQEIKRLKNL